MQVPPPLCDEYHHILDVRAPNLFAAGHLPGSTNIPLPVLPVLMCMLPPRDAEEQHFVVIVASNAEEEAAAIAHVSAAGYAVCAYRTPSPALSLCDHGPSRRLWRPNAFLSDVLSEVESRLGGPISRWTALDVACGSGRDAVFLALRGWTVTAFDNNVRLLACAQAMSVLEQVPSGHFCIFEADVCKLGALIQPGEMFNLVHIARFLDRRLFEPASSSANSSSCLRLDSVVAPGGFVVYHTFTEPCTKPSKTKHVLRRDELRALFADRLHWEIVRHCEMRLGDGRPVQCVCARKPLTPVSADSIDPSDASTSKPPSANTTSSSISSEKSSSKR